MPKDVQSKPEMTEQEAHKIAGRIRQHLDRARDLILDFYERKGWMVLGYETWSDCVAGEFGQSRQALHLQLEAARVSREITEHINNAPTDVNLVDVASIPDRHLNAVKPLPNEKRIPALQQAKKESPNSKPTTSKVKEVVNKILGRTKINGKLAEDPPDIAKARARGQIPENAVVEVEEPDEPTTLEEVMDDCTERQAIADDVSDEEWLDSLPLAGKLSAQCQKVHDNDAIRWRHSSQARNHFKHQVARLLPKTIAIVGAYSALLRQFVVTNGPERWRICPTPENGGCNGVGTNALGTCHRCHGRGYWIP